jgi:succinoglycan biosynthesis protein ExoM
MHIAVCCVTFRRPDGLRHLLEGLNHLTFVKNPVPEITVIVVDNDRARPMQPLVEAYAPTFRWSLRYDCEPVQGIASARNRTLALVPSDADYIAFIDDDEMPAPVWLDELLFVSRTFDAPIVQGPLRPVFETPPPRWILDGRFFEMGPYSDGARLHFAAAGNSLVRSAVIRRLRLSFDERFNRSGGEDQHFFGRAIRAGHHVVTAGHALVLERVPAQRATLGYLLRRRFRIGTTLAMIDRIEGGRARLGGRAIKGCGRIGLGLAQSVLLLRHGFAGVVTGLCNIAWGAGALAGVVGVVHLEYTSLPTAGPADLPRASEKS